MGPRVSQHNAPNRVTTSKTLPSCRSYESRLSPRRQLPIRGREEDGVALDEASRKVNDTRRCHQRRTSHNRTGFSSVALHIVKSPRSLPVPIRCLAPPPPQQLAIEAPLTAEGTRLKPSPSTSTRSRSNHRAVQSQFRHGGLHPRQGTTTRMDPTRTSDHTPAPTPPRHRRTPHTEATGRPLPAKTLPGKASQRRRRHGCARTAATASAGAPPTSSILLRSTQGSRDNRRTPCREHPKDAGQRQRRTRSGPRSPDPRSGRRQPAPPTRR